MRYLILVVACCGCIATEGLKTSQAAIDDHAKRQIKNLTEVARLTSEYPISPRMAELLRETALSSARVQAWTQLTQEHLGRAEAPTDIMTEAEVGAQALYRQQIELRRRLLSAIPFEIPGVGGGGDLSGIGSALAGGGPFALISMVTGLILKRKSRQAKELKDQKAVSDAAVHEAMEIIRTSPDPQIRKRAAKKANLVRVYAEKKQSEYETRAMQLERGGDLLPSGRGLTEASDAEPA
jgi:hypothetical protein